MNPRSYLPPTEKLASIPEPVPEKEPDKLAAFKAGGARALWWLETYSADPKFDYDPDYLFSQDEANQGYEPEVMVDAESVEHAQYLRSQIDEDLKQKETAASSWTGMMGEIGAQFLLPENYVGGALFGAGKIGWKGLAAVDTLAVAGTETILHTQQYSRTAEESMLNTSVALGTQLVLGKAISMMNRIPEPTVVKDLSPPPAGVKAENMAEGGSLSAAETELPMTLDEMKMASGEFLARGPFGAPLNKILVNQESPDAMAAALQLVESATMTKGGEAGKTLGTSVEAAKYRWIGELESAIDTVTPKVKESGLVKDEFWAEVREAMIHGDKHANPAVQDAAVTLRKQVDALETELKNTGLLPKTRAEMTEELNEEAGRDVAAELDTYLANKQDFEENVIGKAPTASIAGVPDELVESWATAPKTSKVHDWTRSRVEEEILAKAEDPAAAKATLKQYGEDLVAHKKAVEHLEPPKLEIEGVRPKTLSKWLSSPTHMPKFAESYFPRRYVTQGIFENWEQVKGQLAQSFQEAGIEDLAEAQDAALNAMTNMMGGEPSMRANVGVGRADSLKQRMVSLTDDALSPYLEKRADVVLREHVRSTAPYVEMQKRFGEVDLADVGSKINATYKRKIDLAATPEEKARLQAKQNETIENLSLLRDRVLNRQDGANQRGPMHKASRFVTAWNAATQLGGIVLSSIPDLARPLMAYGMKPFATGLAKTVGLAFQSKAFRDANRQAIKKIGVALERARNQRAMDLMESDLAPGEAGTRFLGQWWSKLSGFNVYTDIAEHMTAQIAGDWLMRQAAKAAAGRPLKRSVQGRLARMGLDVNVLPEIHRVSRQAKSPQGDLWAPNMALWEDQALARNVQEALSAETRMAIVRIGAGDKPKFMDEAAYQLLFQYWSFGMASVNRMLLAGIQQRDVQLLQGLLASMALGAMVRGVKGELRGDDTSKWSPGKWVVEGIDGSGLGGLYGTPLRLLPYTWGEESSRYKAREIESLFPIAGPTASTIGNISRAAAALMEEGGPDWEKAGKYGARATPILNNTWHVRQALERAGGIGEDK